MTKLKTLSYQAILKLKFPDKPLSDSNENRGLRVECSKTGKKRFIYRYRRKDGKLVEMTLGYFPQLQLAEARLKLQELKKIRELGLCPKTEQKNQKHNELKQQELSLQYCRQCFQLIFAIVLLPVFLILRLLLQG